MDWTWSLMVVRSARMLSAEPLTTSVSFLALSMMSETASSSSSPLAVMSLPMGVKEMVGSSARVLTMVCRSSVALSKRSKASFMASPAHWNASMASSSTVSASCRMSMASLRESPASFRVSAAARRSSTARSSSSKASWMFSMGSPLALKLSRRVLRAWFTFWKPEETLLLA